MSTIESGPGPPVAFAQDDVEHLRLLSIFHYVVAGLIALASLAPAIHFVIGLLMATGRLAAEDDASHVIGWGMAGCASFFIVVGFCFAATVAIAGRSLQERRRYTFCLVVAAVLCLVVPFGTLLGIFTILVLVRPSVRALFADARPA